MKCMLKGILVTCVLFISAENSSALWLGLSDGTYSVNLTPNNADGPSGAGTITISGPGISSWNIDFTDLTQNFTGNPFDSDNFPPCCEDSAQSVTEGGLGHQLVLQAEFANNVDPAPWVWTRFESDRSGVLARIDGSWTYAPVDGRTVPEPSTAILLGFGLIVLARLCKRIPFHSS